MKKPLFSGPFAFNTCSYKGRLTDWLIDSRQAYNHLANQINQQYYDGQSDRCGEAVQRGNCANRTSVCNPPRQNEAFHGKQTLVCNQLRQTIDSSPVNPLLRIACQSSSWNRWCIAGRARSQWGTCVNGESWSIFSRTLNAYAYVQNANYRLLNFILHFANKQHMQRYNLYTGRLYQLLTLWTAKVSTGYILPSGSNLHFNFWDSGTLARRHFKGLIMFGLIFVNIGCP